MTIRFRDEENKYRIVDTDRVEIEFTNGIESKTEEGKWVISDGR